MRPDVDEQIPAPDRSLQQIARRQFVAASQFIGHETVRAWIGRELRGKAEMKPRISVR